MKDALALILVVQGEQSETRRARSVTARVRAWNHVMVVAIPSDVAIEQGILAGDVVDFRIVKRRQK